VAPGAPCPSHSVRTTRSSPPTPSAAVSPARRCWRSPMTSRSAAARPGVTLHVDAASVRRPLRLRSERRYGRLETGTSPAGTSTMRSPRAVSNQPGCARGGPCVQELLSEARDRAVELPRALEDMHLPAPDQRQRAGRDRERLAVEELRHIARSRPDQLVVVMPVRLPWPSLGGGPEVYAVVLHDLDRREGIGQPVDPQPTFLRRATDARGVATTSSPVRSCRHEAPADPGRVRMRVAHAGPAHEDHEPEIRRAPHALRQGCGTSDGSSRRSAPRTSPETDSARATDSARPYLPVRASAAYGRASA
jgi:hypothetical protein